MSSRPDMLRSAASEIAGPSLAVEVEAESTGTVPIAVVIPTFRRGGTVFGVLDRIQNCYPKPAEIWIHIDLADGAIERELVRKFPNIGILSSPQRQGPGG